MSRLLTKITKKERAAIKGSLSNLSLLPAIPITIKIKLLTQQKLTQLLKAIQIYMISKTTREI